MKDYEIIYINLFKVIKKPEDKVIEALIKTRQGRFCVLNVIVKYKCKEGEHPWFISGDKEFENLSKSELTDFIYKLKYAETYYMSGDDYEIVGMEITYHDKKNDGKIQVAVAHDDGHFSIVELKKNRENVVFKTDWTYLTKDNIDNFVSDVKKALID